MKWAMRGAAASVLAAMTMLAGSVIAQDRTTLASEREKFSYAVGMDFGGRIKPVVPFMDMAAFEAALKQAFRLLFREGLTISNALIRMEAEVKPLPEIQHLIAFTRASERGISK
jgi:acyl-[acyl carrier protein]--UDP-N-acetylglucosamine O-acyltransferase